MSNKKLKFAKTKLTVKSIQSNFILHKDVYNYFTSQYKNLFADEELKKIFLYIISSAYYNNFDDDNWTKILCSADILAALLEKEGKDENEKDWYNNKFYIRPRLERLKEHLPNLKWSHNWNKYTYQPTYIENIGLSQHEVKMIKDSRIQDLLSKDKLNNHILLESGNKFSKEALAENSLKVEKDEDSYIASLRIANKISNDQLKIIDYLSRRSKKIFDNLFSKNQISTVEHLLSLDLKEEELDREIRILTTLKRGYKKPIYTISEESDSLRISPICTSMLSLRRDLRKKMMAGNTDADLKSCQFAIISAYLGAEKCNKFLSEGKSLWNELGNYIGSDYNPDIHKDILKKAVYSICYGMKEDKVRANLKEVHPSLEKAIDHEMIQELLSLRQDWFDRIYKNKGEYDAYGRFLSLFDKDGELKQVNSIAACVIQSYEFQIMSAVFDHAIAEEKKDTTARYEIIAFQYDGVTIKWKTAYSNKKSKESVMKELREVVKKASSRLGDGTVNVITDIEFEDL